MNEVLEFLNSCKPFYLATTEGDQPRVRPFGVVCEFEGNLYIATSNQKRAYTQMLNNPKVEISGTSKGIWLRVEGKAIRDDRHEARQAMIDANPAALRKMYTANDNLFEVLYLKDATATFCSFTLEPRIIKF